MKSIVAENIKRLRKQKDLSMIELAEVIGVSQSTVSDWELGKKLPRSAALDRLSKFFKISQKALLDNIEEQVETVDIGAVLGGKGKVVFGGKLLTAKDKALILKLVKAVVGSGND